MHEPVTAAAQPIEGAAHTSAKHDSAHKHVAGAALYIDDMPEPVGLAHAGLGLSTRTHATIVSMDLSAVRAVPGVLCVLTHEDVPGVNDVSPAGLHDDPIFAEREVMFHGQPMFAVIAETRDIARRAALLACRRFQTTDIAAA